jgi:hypothetical protein
MEGGFLHTFTDFSNRRTNILVLQLLGYPKYFTICTATTWKKFFSMGKILKVSKEWWAATGY